MAEKRREALTLLLTDVQYNRAESKNSIQRPQQRQICM